MAKYYGNVGYIKTEETVPGVWDEVVIERPYFGDVLRNSKRFQFQSEGTNDNIVMNNTISIVADPYACEYHPYIKYCWWKNVAWKVESITVEYPRITLEIGGVWNGKTSETQCGT